MSHPTEKCKEFKGQFLQLAKEGKITLDEEDIEESDWPFIKIILENALDEGQPKLSIYGGNYEVTSRILSQMFNTPKWMHLYACKAYT